MACGIIAIGTMQLNPLLFLHRAKLKLSIVLDVLGCHIEPCPRTLVEVPLFVLENSGNLGMDRKIKYSFADACLWYCHLLLVMWDIGTKLICSPFHNLFLNFHECSWVILLQVQSQCSGEMPCFNHGLEGHVQWPREAHLWRCQNRFLEWAETKERHVR